ncbi:hypothetical protein ACFL67_02855 [candidate division KSB1 bacterium]
MFDGKAASECVPGQNPGKSVISAFSNLGAFIRTPLFFIGRGNHAPTVYLYDGGTDIPVCGFTGVFSYQKLHNAGGHMDPPLRHCAYFP